MSRDLSAWCVFLTYCHVSSMQENVFVVGDLPFLCSVMSSLGCMSTTAQIICSQRCKDFGSHFKINIDT